jgi:hypothetical protein
LPLLANSGVRAEAEIAVKKIAEAIKAQSGPGSAEPPAAKAVIAASTSSASASG